MGDLIPFERDLEDPPQGAPLASAGAPVPGYQRLLVFVLSVIALVASVHVYREDQRDRKEIGEFSRRYTITERRPFEAATADVAASADMALWVLGRATLDDALTPVSLSRLSPDERQLWYGAITNLDSQLASAEKLLVWAISRRPGWAFHRVLLGQIHYVKDRRRASRDLVEKAALWRVPLANGLKAGPGIGSAHVFLAGALLENWSQLSANEKTSAERTFALAFTDTQFLSQSLLATMSFLGPEATFALLPPRPGHLSLALDALAKTGDARLYSSLFTLWEKASLSARTTDLATAEARLMAKDTVGLRTACRAWAGNHRLTDFDRPAERRQGGRILELWPPDTSGAWRNDPRGEMVRFFLNGRLADVPPAALARALYPLSNVPDVVRARVLLESGDRYGFDSILRTSETVGSLQWTSFFVRLASLELASGRKEEARQALAHIPAAARRECEVLLLRRDMSRGEGPAKATDSIQAELDSAVRTQFEASDFTEAGSLPLCLDPASSSREITVRLSPKAASAGGEVKPVFVSYGFDGGRSGTALVEAETELKIPLEGRQGRRFLEFRRLAGGSFQLISASLAR